MANKCLDVLNDVEDSLKAVGRKMKDIDYKRFVIYHWNINETLEELASVIVDNSNIISLEKIVKKSKKEE